MSSLQAKISLNLSTPEHEFFFSKYITLFIITTAELFLKFAPDFHLRP
jgi:hypothetical protein